MTMVAAMGSDGVDRSDDIGGCGTPCRPAVPIHDLESLQVMGERLEAAPAEEIVRWAVSEFGAGLTLAASFQDCVLIDIATRIDAAVDVVFLDTHFHFAETLTYADAVRRRYGLRLRVMDPIVPLGSWPCGSARCCEMRKVAPLDHALEGSAAWMSGLRRTETPERSGTPVVGLDVRRGIAKVNPLATWTDRQVEQYVIDHELPVHPLTGRGYPSIGCAPTTSQVAPGAPPRSGRWADSTTTECGIHR